VRIASCIVATVALLPGPQAAPPKAEARPEIRVAPYADALKLSAAEKGFRRVYVVRHGQSVGNATHDDPKLTDAEKDHLTEQGRVECAALGPVLKDLHVVAAEVSPMQRARESAVAIGGCYPRRTPLEEIERAEWRGLALGKPSKPGTSAIAELSAAWSRGEDPRLDGGETLAEMAERTKRRAREIAAADPAPIAIVAHSEIVCAWLAEFDAAALPKLVASSRIPNAAFAAFDVRQGDTLEVKPLGVFAPEEKPAAPPK
jgi:broad specificity phosphatase PhoE